MTTTRHKDHYSIASRGDMLIAVALALAVKPGGWCSLTRSRIAIAANCSDALVSRALGTMVEVRRRIMREAIRKEMVEIIVQSIAAHDGYVPKLTPSLRRKALSSLLEK